MDARLLGPLEIRAAGTRVALGPRARRALLARLLLEPNRTVAVDRLVDDLWGDDVPPSAVKMIHIHVSKLRRVLPAGALVTRAPGYAIELDPEALDAVRFERLREQGRAALAVGHAAEAADRLRRALLLWRGPALAEFDAPFAAVEARRLEETHLACIEDRFDAELAVGEHARIVPELATFAAQHPLRERVHAQHMLALYRSGRQAEALAAYRELRRTLATDLGLEPSPALRALELQILQQDPALDVAARPAPALVLAA